MLYNREFLQLSIQIITLSNYLNLINAFNCTTDPGAVGCSISNPLNFSSQISNRDSGEYYFKIAPEIPVLKLFLDMADFPVFWIRLNYKLSTTQYFTHTTSSEFVWTENMTAQFVGFLKDFGWSDSLLTMKTSYSWILKNVTLSAGPETVSKSAMNEFNGLSPTGTAWSTSYSVGYLNFGGTLQTYGTYSSIFWGCSGYKNIGDLTSFRSGGAASHEGKYIHGLCNDYTTASYSITSKIGWTNSRVFWTAFKFYLDSIQFSHFNF